MQSELINQRGAHSIFDTLVRGLEAQFGAEAGGALAQRFVEAEETDFLWAARITERWLGRYEALEAKMGPISTGSLFWASLGGDGSLQR